MDIVTLVHQIVFILGAVSSGSFVVIAIGDALVKFIDSAAAATGNQTLETDAAVVDGYWAKVKAWWDLVRPWLDKLSIYSRPKDQIASK